MNRQARDVIAVWDESGLLTLTLVDQDGDNILISDRRGTSTGQEVLDFYSMYVDVIKIVDRAGYRIRHWTQGGTSLYEIHWINVYKPSYNSCVPREFYITDDLLLNNGIDPSKVWKVKQDYDNR